MFQPLIGGDNRAGYTPECHHEVHTSQCAAPPTPTAQSVGAPKPIVTSSSGDSNAHPTHVRAATKCYGIGELYLHTQKLEHVAFFAGLTGEPISMSYCSNSKWT